ncbi:MAG: replication restart helicase PriA [Candidatus Dormibacteria bacterium]
MIDTHTGQREEFDYSVPEGVQAQPGSRVMVPFGRRRLMGYVIGPGEPPPDLELRPVEEAVDTEPLLPPAQVALVRWMAAHYHAPLVDVIHAALPPAVRRAPSNRPRPGPRRQSLDVQRATGGAAPTRVTLTDAQRAAVEAALAGFDPGAAPGPVPLDCGPLVASRGACARLLLHGVAASGKTEVYLAVLEQVVALGGQAIVLVPELALTPQAVARFAARFPGRLAVLHSRLTEAERAQQWWRARRGDVDLVLGSRSALFAPLPALRAVIVDEEDSLAYKQDRLPRYHAADSALVLAAACSGIALLGSATPRVTTSAWAQSGELELLRLPHRVTGSWPEVRIADRRREPATSPFGSVLAAEVTRALDRGRQVILFLNRRGHSTALLCDHCGAQLGCPDCSVSLVWHRDPPGLFCHYCGHREDRPGNCPACGRARLRSLGIGTERLEAETGRVFPGARVLRLDRDTASRRDEHVRIYETFRRGEADILLGTQMVIKGFDLPTVAVVGVVDADMPLHHPTYRAGEEAFATVVQAAGRAGRGREDGVVVVQTWHPEHYALSLAVAGRYEEFFEAEMEIRHRHDFPPFSALVTATLSLKDEGRAQSEAALTTKRLREAMAGWANLEVLGPAPAEVHKLRGEYRWEVTLKGRDLQRAYPLLPAGRGWSIDVDPV